MKCKRCGAEANDQVLTPEGPHYGKLVCKVCRTFLGWLPKPPTPELPLDEEKLPQADNMDMLPALKGVSERQIEFGGNCRSKLLDAMHGRVSERIYRAAVTIVDSTFWIANKDRQPNQVKWPREWARKT